MWSSSLASSKDADRSGPDTTFLEFLLVLLSGSLPAFPLPFLAGEVNLPSYLKALFSGTKGCCFPWPEDTQVSLAGERLLGWILGLFRRKGQPLRFWPFPSDNINDVYRGEEALYVSLLRGGRCSCNQVSGLPQ